MKFQFSEKKVKLPGNVHAYAEKKVMKLARYFEEDAQALIVFSVEKNRNNVELTVRGAGTWFRAHESTSDMFASIDAAVGTIEGQIRKNKTRLARRLRQDAFARTVEETSFATDEPEEKLEIVKVKQFYFKPMTREEAVQLSTLPKGAEVYALQDNTCPAYQLEGENIHAILLPPEPTEQSAVFLNSVFPTFAQQKKYVCESHVLRVMDLSLSEVELALKDGLTSENPCIAVYPGKEEVVVRVSARAQDPQQAASACQSVFFISAFLSTC